MSSPPGKKCSTCKWPGNKANCRQSLNTAWLIMHSPYLRHLRERLAHGGRHTSAVKQNLCCLLCSCLHNCQHVLALVYIDIRWQVLMLQLPVSMSQPTQLLYNRCAQSDCPSWLSSISIIFQAHLRASYLRLSWMQSCMTILLMVALNYSIQKHTD